MAFKKIEIDKLSINPFEKIGKEWFLLASGETNNYNMMTASWGMMGFMWGKPIINVVVRPQRYTFEYMQDNDLFTISFYDESFREKLNICGTKSGRDISKAEICGFDVIECDGSVAFEQANMVFVCKKIYTQDLLPECFIDKSLDKKWYPNKDYHKSYVGEIVGVYVKE